MKEIRYNDRLWFGKHKGQRICEIIKGDPAYVQKLVNEYKIRLDEKSNNYFEERIGRRPRPMPMGMPEPPVGINVPNDRYNVQCSANSGQATMMIRPLVNDLFNRTGVSNDVINAVAETFTRKYRDLGIRDHIDITLRVSRLQENRLTPRDITMVVHSSIDGSVLGAFDLT